MDNKDSATSKAPGLANFSQPDQPVSPHAGGGDASYYDDMLTRLGGPRPWPADKEHAILEPFSYLDAHPGKEVRSRLIEAFNVWLRVPPAQLDAIRNVVRMLHTASLLMDDVEDNSDLRRGIPVAHKIYGVPQTINTANYVYFLVFSQIFAMADAGRSSKGKGKAVSSDTSSFDALGDSHAEAQSMERLIVDELINLHRGQGMDLLWRDSLTCPTEEEYVDMVNNKTGGLFRIAIKLMVAQSTTLGPSASTSIHTPPDLIPLANLIGLLFQIRDDYMNLQSAAYAENKGFCEDLTEGKFSFPIIHSIRASAALGSMQDSMSSEAADAGACGGGNRQILNVLKQRPTDEATKSYAVSYMRNVTRSFAYTRDVLRRLDAQARTEVERVGKALADMQRRGREQGAGAAADASEGHGDGSNLALLAILDGLRSGWYDVKDDD